MKTFFTKYSFIFIAIILTMIFVAPYKVNALSYKSDYIDLENSVELETDEFIMDLEYTVFSNGTAEKPSAITGHSLKKIHNTYYYHYVIYYYNANKEEIGATDGYNHITNAIANDSNIKQSGNYISSFLESKKMYSNHQLSEIKYYKLFIEPSTQEITNQYLYQNNKKLNENGLDEITDFNTISMKVTNLQDKTTNSENYNKPSQNSYYSSYDYVIDKYDINIIVNENNTFDITETITAYFNVSKHGIIRTIPLKNTITRLDGTTSTNRAQITNLSIDNEYSTSKENGNYKIQIGSKDHTLTGEQTYVIKYTYNIGKDPIKDYDELYYNIIGNEWDTVIGNVTFTITMPKEFDSSKLGFSSGKTGSTDNSNVKYNINENTISGSYDGILRIGEALTVRCELDEGYFVGAGFTTSSIVYLMFIIPILFLIISLLLWYKFGHDDQTVETVEFYPPEGFNSLEIGFLYKGKADNQDVTSLLVYLANKGYIKISETEEKSLFSTSKGFKITKLKEYDGNNLNEQIFLNGLFTKKASFTSLFSKTEEIPTNHVNEVTKMDLYDNFYITMEKILSNINKKENKNKIFEKSTSGKSFIVILLMIISIMTTIAIPTMEYAGIGELGMTLFICAFYIPFFAVGIFAKIPLLARVFWLGFTIFHSFFFFSSLPIAEAITNDPIYLFGFIIGIVCLIGMIICFKLMPKRTKYGNEMLGKLRGFKNFLETAEKDKLEAMVMQDPSYFYNILPYTYVLGVSDMWIKKFETISLQAPLWYDSPTAFNVATFGTFINSTMVSAKNAMSSSPSSSSSGGSSSGGGSSGGGSGGGGGSSW